MIIRRTGTDRVGGSELAGLALDNVGARAVDNADNTLRQSRGVRLGIDTLNPVSTFYPPLHTSACTRSLTMTSRLNTD
jgi:hypothetical protein